MLTNLIMTGIALSLGGMLLAGAKYRPDGGHFFDRENSGAMRGFWCISPRRIRTVLRICWAALPMWAPAFSL